MVLLPSKKKTRHTQKKKKRKKRKKKEVYLLRLTMPWCFMNVGDILRQRPKMWEQFKSSLGFFRSVIYGESSPKFQMYNEQKSNGALTRENNNASNKSVEKV